MKQHEYRAKIRAQETSDEREGWNKRQREYRARRKAESTSLTKAPDQPGATKICCLDMCLLSNGYTFLFCSFTMP